MSLELRVGEHRCKGVSIKASSLINKGDLNERDG